VAGTDIAVFDSSVPFDCLYGIIGAGPIYIFTLLIMPEKSSHKRRLRRRLLILFLSVPIFILLTEIFLAIIPIDAHFRNRFFLVNRALDYPEVFKKDYYLFWRLRPDQTVKSRFFEGKEYRINFLGLRGPDLPPKTDKLRIVAMGNSCTFGWGMTDNEIYVKRLESCLNAISELPPVEVINAGIPGYSSFQGRRFFNSDILELQPDIVLLLFAWNDQWAAAGNIADKDQQMPPPFILDIQNLFSRLRLYRLIKKILLTAIEKPLESQLIKENTVYRVDVVDFYNNLEVIVESCKREGIIPVLLTSPIPSLEKYYPPWKRSPMHQYHADYNFHARLLGRNTRVPVIDLAAEFDKYDDLYDDAAYDPIHFNAKGHEVAAETICRYFLEHQIIK